MREDCVRAIGQAELVASLHSELQAFCETVVVLLRELGTAPPGRLRCGAYTQTENQAKVLAMFADGPKRLQDIRRLTGQSAAAGNSFLNGLIDRGLLRRVKRGVYALTEAVSNGAEATDA